MRVQQVEEVISNFNDPNSFMEVHTSGSTGVPKVIKLQKEHMQASARMTLDFLKLSAGDRALLCMSPAHIGGIMMIIRSLVGKLELISVEPKAQPLNEVKGDFDFAAMVPYQVAASMGDLSRIKKLIIGGGPISPELETKLRELPNEIYHTYGMTETISHIAMRRVNGADSDVFRVLPGIELSTDHRGCLVVNAPTLGVKDLITNDLVELKNFGSFVWLGRYDNVVNSAGVKLHPESIEKKIGPVGHPYFLAGVPDSKFGEILIMVLESRQEMSLDDFKEQFNALNKYEIPKRIFSVSKFAMTGSGKLNRKETLKTIQQ